MTDEEKIQALLDVLAPDRTMTIRVEHEAQPLPKERARHDSRRGRYGHYTPDKTAAAEYAISLRFRAALLGRIFERNVLLIAIFYRQTRQVVDGDNLMKLAKDAGSKARIWRDDSQVTAEVTLVELDKERPRTVLVLADTTSTLERGPPKARAAAKGTRRRRAE